MLVTGGTCGIGLATVRELLLRGCQVLTCARHAPADGLLDQRVGFYACDLACSAQREALVEQLRREHPDLAVLVNNAAGQYLIDFLEAPVDEIRETTQLEISLNLEAPMLLTAGLLPTLIRQPQAAVVNVTTGLALAPKRSAPVYCATKAALRSFTRSLRYQLESRAPHVRVQEVLPPLVDTRMTTGRGSGKKSPESVAVALVNAIAQEREECYVGKSRLLKVMLQWAPSVAYRVLKAW